MNAARALLAVVLAATLGVTACGADDPAVTRADYLMRRDYELNRRHDANAELDHGDDLKMTRAEQARLYDERASLNQELAALSRWKCPAVAEGYAVAADALTHLADYERALDGLTGAEFVRAFTELGFLPIWLFVGANQMLDDERVTDDCWTR